MDRGLEPTAATTSFCAELTKPECGLGITNEQCLKGYVELDDNALRGAVEGVIRRCHLHAPDRVAHTCPHQETMS